MLLDSHARTHLLSLLAKQSVCGAWCMCSLPTCTRTHSMHDGHVRHLCPIRALPAGLAVNFSACNFTANTSPNVAGALCIDENARALVSATVFLNNTCIRTKTVDDLGTGGAVFVNTNATREDCSWQAVVHALTTLMGQQLECYQFYTVHSAVQYCGRGSQTSALACEPGAHEGCPSGRTYPSLSGQVWGRLKSPTSQPSIPVTFF
jgi:hypothetical protein